MKEKLLYYPGSGGKDSEGKEYKLLPVEDIRHLSSLREDEAVEMDHEDFYELYGEEAVAKDLEEVERMHEIWEEEQETQAMRAPAAVRDRERELIKLKKELSSAVEYALSYACGSYDWFGDGVELILTSKFDDLKGIDVVAEAAEEGDTESKIQPLTIDVTRGFPTRIDYSKEEQELRMNEIRIKLEKADEVVCGRKKKEVKYFRSEHNQEVQRLERVVPIVVAIEPQRAMDLVRRLSHILKEQKRSKTEAETQALKAEQKLIENDPLQIIILKEIESQLLYFKDELSAKTDEYSQALSRSIAGVLEHVSRTLSAKRREFIAKKIKVPHDDSAEEIEAWIKERRKSLAQSA